MVILNWSYSIPRPPLSSRSLKVSCIPIPMKEPICSSFLSPHQLLPIQKFLKFLFADLLAHSQVQEIVAI